MIAVGVWVLPEGVGLVPRPWRGDILLYGVGRIVLRPDFGARAREDARRIDGSKSIEVRGDAARHERPGPLFLEESRLRDVGVSKHEHVEGMEGWWRGRPVAAGGETRPTRRKAGGQVDGEIPSTCGGQGPRQKSPPIDLLIAIGHELTSWKKSTAGAQPELRPAVMHLVRPAQVRKSTMCLAKNLGRSSWMECPV